MKKTTIKWTEYARNHFKMQSRATSWETLAKDFKAVWMKALELLSQEETKTNVEVIFFTDSGRAAICDDAGAIYWLVSCSSPWLESAVWNLSKNTKDEAELESAYCDICIQFARTFLQAAQHLDVVQIAKYGKITIYGEGHDQSPSSFEVALKNLVKGKIPKLIP